VLGFAIPQPNLQLVITRFQDKLGLKIQPKNVDWISANSPGFSYYFKDYVETWEYSRFLNPVVGWVEVTKPFGYAQGNAQQTQKTFSQLPVSGDQLPVSVWSKVIVWA